MCPHCAALSDCESVDVGVGVIHGPWGCSNCGWSECPEYDSRDGIRRAGDGRVFDQYGVSHHVDRNGGAVVLAGLNVGNRGERNRGERKS
jgi:hypothetical protein